MYDAKENIIIYNKNLNKYYITISHRWNLNNQNMDMDIDKKINKIRTIYKKNNKLRYYWIDILCINQKDENEKISEIKNMNYYYKNSLMTIILNDTEISEIQIKMLNYLTIICYEDIKKNNPNNVMLIALNNIMNDIKFKDDWHERCWTFQETILNENTFIYVNNYNFLSLNLLSTFCFYYKTYRDKNTLFSLCSMISKLKGKTNIGKILNVIVDRSSFLKQDRIYSILGLIDSRISDNIVIDYTLKKKEIYINLFKEALNINDISWLNISIGIDSSPIDILYKKIIIDNNKLYFKSYIIENNQKNLLEIKKIKEVRKDFFNFIKKWMFVNNITLDNETLEIAEIILNLYLEKYDRKIENSHNLKILNSFIQRPSYIKTEEILSSIFTDEANIDKVCVISNNKIIGMINCSIEDDMYFVLNDCKNLPLDWSSCIVLKGNHAIGHGIINLDKKYCVEKDVVIDIEIRDGIDEDTNLDIFSEVLLYKIRACGF